MHVFAAAAAVVAGLSTASYALPQISAYGSKFFTSNGQQWFIKGVAYQLSGGDPLLDKEQCQVDAGLMHDLGANAIRVYHVEDGDHSGCMRAFAEAGIYLFVDMESWGTTISPSTPTWTTSLFDAYKKVMDDFQQYDNTAGFLIGNEIINQGDTSSATPYIKAAVRDMKAYREASAYRQIPIGYAHADVTVLLPNLQNYLVCGGNASESIDFFGLNTYRWCGDNTYEGSGYASLTEDFKEYPVPVFITETGCNVARPRTFQDQMAIFGPEMTPYWSGAIIYEWIQKGNYYGLVSYDDNTDASKTQLTGIHSISGTPRPVTPDFSNLMTAWESATPTGFSLEDYMPSVTTPSCPTYVSGAWEVSANAALPSLAGKAAGTTTKVVRTTTTQTSMRILPSTLSHVAPTMNALPVPVIDGNPCFLFDCV